MEVLGIKRKIKQLKITPDSIDIATCVIFDTEQEDLMIKSKIRDVAEPRMVCMALRQLLLGQRQREAGDRFFKNHATAYHAKKKFFEFYSVEIEFRNKIRLIMATMGLPPEYFDTLL